MTARSAAVVARFAAAARSPLARRSAGRIGARIASSALQAVTLLLLARALGATDFGRFAVGLAVAYVLSALLGWGGQARVLRAAAEDRPDAVRSSLALVQLGAVVLLLAVALLLHAVQVLDTASTAGFALGLSDQINTFAQNDAAGRGAHAHASALAVQQRAVPTLALLLTLGHFRWEVLLVAVAIATVPPLLFVVRRLTRPARAGLAGGAGYWSYGLIQASPQLEAPVVNAVADAAVAGLYGIANRVANPLTILSSALASVFIPEIAAADSEERRRALGRRLVVLSIAYAGVVALSAIWIAPVVVAIVGRQFAPAEPLIAATTVAAGLSAVSQAVNAVLIAAGRPFASTLALAVGTAVSLTGLAVFASIDGARLLWVAPLVTQVVVLTLFAVIVRRSAPAAPQVTGTPAAPARVAGSVREPRR